MTLDTNDRRMRLSRDKAYVAERSQTQISLSITQSDLSFRRPHEEVWIVSLTLSAQCRL